MLRFFSQSLKHGILYSHPYSPIPKLSSLRFGLLPHHQMNKVKFYSKEQFLFDESEIMTQLNLLKSLQQVPYDNKTTSNQTKQKINLTLLTKYFMDVAILNGDEQFIKMMISSAHALHKNMFEEYMKLMKSHQISFMEIVNRLTCSKKMRANRSLMYDEFGKFIHLALIEAAYKLDDKFISTYFNHPQRVDAKEIHFAILHSQGSLSKKVDIMLWFQGMNGSQVSLNYKDDMLNNYLHLIFKEDVEPWFVRPEIIPKLIPLYDNHSNGYGPEYVFMYAKNKDGMTPLKMLLESKNPYKELIIREFLNRYFQQLGTRSRQYLRELINNQEEHQVIAPIIGA